MALTVRREGAASSGTISRPIPVAIDLSRVDPAPIERQQLLGYEAIPSTAVWGFNSPRRFELRLRRSSEDRYAVHIQITVINGRGQTVYAITRSDGEGEWAVLPAGEYRVVAALLIPEQVELGLTIDARPARTRLGPVIASGRGDGVLRQAGGIPLVAAGDSPSQATIQQPLLVGAGGGTGGGLGLLLVVRSSNLRCLAIGDGSGSAGGTLAPMVWVDAYGRPLGSSITVAPVALDHPELVQGNDWAVITRLIEQGTSAPKDLTDLVFAAAIWDLERSYRYAIPTITVASLAGGPITAALSAAETPAVGDYEGQPLLFELTATDSAGRLAYLLEGVLTVRLGASLPL